MKLPNILGYKINDAVLVKLAFEGCPAVILQDLKKVKDIDFNSYTSFHEKITEVLTTHQSKYNIARIMKASKRLNMTRVFAFTKYQYGKFVANSSLLPSISNSLRQRPSLFTLWFRLRWLLLTVQRIITGKPKLTVYSNISEHLKQNVVPYNASQVLSFIDGHRERTERLINLLRTIRELNPSSSKILSVGPRNEAELLLFATYGFKLANLTGIDLFTYSPHIKAMDMHDLQFPDNSFDVYYSAYTLRYSDDIRKACDEALRVTRPGGIIVLGNTYGTKSHLVADGSELNNGLADIIELFKQNITHTYWQEDYEGDGGEHITSIIFKIDK